MGDQDKALPQRLFPFIWHFLRAYKPVVVLYVLLAILAGFWGPFNSLLMKQLLNLLPHVQEIDASLLILPASLTVMNFIIFDNVTWRGINYIRARFIPLVTGRIWDAMLDHCLGQSHQFYQDNLSGSLAKQINSLAESVESLISNVAVNFLRGASLLLVAFITAYSANPIFCFILMIWFVSFAGISIWMSKKLVLLADTQASAESTLSGQAVDVLSSHSTVRIFSRRSYERARMVPFLKEYQKSYTAMHLYALRLYAVQAVLITLMMAFSISALIYLYGKGLVTIGDFALILSLSMETGHMIWFTMSQIDVFNEAVGRGKQSLKALIAPLEVQDCPNAMALACTQGAIVFKNVKFHYKDTHPLFQNKSVTIPAGQKVGLVGYSGSGKSTFVNLMLRLYDVTGGAILIDGQDIREVTQDSLRAHIAMIPQDPALFHRSLMENIRYGKPDATVEEVIAAAKAAHAHAFISKLPQGYDTRVGERGVKLSGGQRQRIAIARAILKNAPLLILDEATSQLDSVTELLIQESLWGLMQGKTTLVIAHRLSTLLQMDRILVFDQGKIIEDGSHATLLAQNGLYKTLWDAQVGGFLGDKMR